MILFLGVETTKDVIYIKIIIISIFYFDAFLFRCSFT